MFSVVYRGATEMLIAHSEAAARTLREGKLDRCAGVDFVEGKLNGQLSASLVPRKMDDMVLRGGAG
jgi:hypothetical protein